MSAFYETYRPMPRYGIPDQPELVRLSGFLSSRLRTLISSAQAYRAREARRCSDCKPPFADGDIFSSNFEGYTDFTVGASSVVGEQMRVPIEFRYVDYMDPKSVTRWQDVAVVVVERGKYVIDDIEFRADWPFANHGSLAAALAARE